jgi:LCP family protein required for cell wall assembly
VDSSGQLIQPPHQVNILLLGSDKRPGQAGFRTDTIILATINSELGTLNLTSFPRDLYIPIPGYGTNRINTAFGAGGFKLLAKTFQENFGVKPDYYVLINFKQFKQFVDDLGGLDVRVGETVSDYRSGRWVTIEKGLNHMDADTVLWYVRTRKTTSDLARNRRQQEVLRAIFDRLLTLDVITRFPQLYDQYDDSLITDMSWQDILPLLPVAAQITDPSRINHYFIGPQQTQDWITYEGAMVLLPIPDQINKIMKKALNIKR